MSSTSAKRPHSPDLASDSECPVCLTTFVDPKSLHCGHSICAKCVQNFGTAARIECPICRETTQVPRTGLAINYVLKNIIERRKGEDEQKHACIECSNRLDFDQFWICSKCNTEFICSTCTVRNHRDANQHDLKLMVEVANERQKELEEIRESIKVRVDHMNATAEEVEADLSSVSVLGREVNTALTRRIDSNFHTVIRRVKAECEDLFKNVDEARKPAVMARFGFRARLDALVASVSPLHAELDGLKVRSTVLLESIERTRTLLYELLTEPEDAGDRSGGVNSGATAMTAASATTVSSTGVVTPPTAARVDRSEAWIYLRVEEFRTLLIRPERYSEAVRIRGLTWQIAVQVLRQGAELRDSLTLSVICSGRTGTMWSFAAQLVFCVVSKRDGTMRNVEVGRTSYVFTHTKSILKLPNFLSWEDLVNRENGYVTDGTFTVKLHVDACGQGSR